MKTKQIIYATCALTLFNISLQAQIITTYAGTGIGGYAGDGYLATAATIGNARGIAAGKDGSIYLADIGCECIYKVNASGTITTVAGNRIAGYSGDGGPATNASLYSPGEIAIDTSGNLYISDEDNSCIRKVSTAGIITTIAGVASIIGDDGDDGPATAAHLGGIWGIAADRFGNIFIADYGYHVIRKINATGIISNYAGMGYVLLPHTLPVYSGDGGPATDAKLEGPLALAVDTLGNLYFSDNEMRIRKVTTSGIITSIAGNDGTGSAGDGAPATAYGPVGALGIAFDRQGNMFFSSANNIKKVDANGIIFTFAGNGVDSSAGDGGLAVFAEIGDPWGVTTDANNCVYVSQRDPQYRVRKITASPSEAVAMLQTIGDAGVGIYPNPAKAHKAFYCMVTATSSKEPARLAIQDMTGQVIYSNTVTCGTVAQLNASLPPGLYLITATTKEQQLTAKLVVE